MEAYVVIQAFIVLYVDGKIMLRIVLFDFYCNKQKKIRGNFVFILYTLYDCVFVMKLLIHKKCGLNFAVHKSFLDISGKLSLSSILLDLEKSETSCMKKLSNKQVFHKRNQRKTCFNVYYVKTC